MLTFVKPSPTAWEHVVNVFSCMGSMAAGQLANMSQQFGKHPSLKYEYMTLYYVIPSLTYEYDVISHLVNAIDHIIICIV